MVNLHYFLEMLGGNRIPSLLALPMLTLTSWFSKVATQQSKKIHQNKQTFNPDVKFKKLKIRRTLIKKLEEELSRIYAFPFPDERDHASYNLVYKAFKPRFFTQEGVPLEEEKPINLDFEDIEDVIEDVLPLLEEAIQLFPKAEHDLEILTELVNELPSCCEAKEKKKFIMIKILIEQKANKSLNLMKEHLGLGLHVNNARAHLGGLPSPINARFSERTYNISSF